MRQVVHTELDKIPALLSNLLATRGTQVVKKSFLEMEEDGDYWEEDDEETYIPSNLRVLLVTGPGNTNNITLLFCECEDDDTTEDDYSDMRALGNTFYDQAQKLLQKYKRSLTPPKGMSTCD